MTEQDRKLLAGAREFVERAFTEVDGRAPSKKTVAVTAKKIAMALRPSIQAFAEHKRRVD